MASQDLARQVLDLANKFTYATGITPNVVIVGPNAPWLEDVIHEGRLCGMRVVSDDMATQDFAVAYTV